MHFEQLGPYRLGRKLGQGGMGAVFEGLDAQSDQHAAVKVLSPALAAEEGFRVRFEAEIDSLKKLNHPHIVRLYGYGEQQGTLFYAMELVDGTSLEDELRAGRRFDWREVTQLAIQVCKALKHAHDHGVIHRDIKPANLLLSADGQIKLSDFGIARLFGNTRLTSEGGVLGTAEYMAPEQADGRSVTDRCDQYSLGGVMYALLAGRPPFRANSLVEMLQMQRFSEPMPVRRYAPETPAELDRIILQLLSKDPQNRFVNTIILAKALEAMERGLSISSSRDDFLIGADSSIAGAAGIDALGPTLIPSTAQAPDPDATGYALDTRETGPVMLSSASLAVTPPGTATLDPEHEPAVPTTRFTKIDPATAGSSDWRAVAMRVLVGPHVLAVLLALLVAAVGLVVWNAVKPPSADVLFAKFQSVANAGRPAALIETEPEIESFLSRFPNDPRAEEVRRYREFVELARADARPLRSVLKSPNNPAMSPEARAYLDVLEFARDNPDEAAAKFQAYVNLYDDGDKTSPTASYCVELARGQLEKLGRDSTEEKADRFKLLEDRLQHAASLVSRDPARARKIYEGIVSLYSTKPWAAEVVEKAKRALAESHDSVQQASGGKSASPDDQP